MEIDIKVAVKIFDAVFQDTSPTEQVKLEVVQQLLFNPEYWPHTFFQKDWQPKVEKILLFHYPEDIYQLSMNPAFVLFKTRKSFNDFGGYIHYMIRKKARNYGSKYHKSLDTEYSHTSSINPITVKNSNPFGKIWEVGDVIEIETEYLKKLKPGDTVIVIDYSIDYLTGERVYLCEYTVNMENTKRYWLKSDIGKKIFSTIKSK